MSVRPETNVSKHASVPVGLCKSLIENGIHTIDQLLWTLPARFEDRTQVAAAGEATEGPVVIQAEIVSSRLRRIGGKRSIFDLTLADHGEGNLAGILTARWFHMPFMQRVFAVGQRVFLYGTVKLYKGSLYVDHPEWELWEEESESIHMSRITPVYRLRGGLKQKALRSCIHALLREATDEDWPDLLRKPSARGPFGGMTRMAALRAAHFPRTPEEAVCATRYLALEEFYQLQVRLLGRRSRRLAGTAPILSDQGGAVRRFLEGLPYKLTKGQAESLREILADMGRSIPMNRMLQGDVGSGKTVLALAAVVRAVESGKQAVIMAPTQILAEQHYTLCKKWLTPLGMQVGLRTGRQPKRKNKGVELPGMEAEMDVWVGTQALLYGGWGSRDLGVIVIDEQHRFGVGQRGKLLEHGAEAHVLVMTATPIPRTLMLTLHGDMDVSILAEKPPGRSRISTFLRPKWRESEIAVWLKTQIAEGRQVYLVYPLVEESASSDVAAATEAVTRWEKFLAPAKVGLLTGRMKAEDKERVMHGFRSNEFPVLVATQVIEVGVDVPNATAILIFHAERFGLAQLHQLRGRVGRGVGESWCLLFPGKAVDEEGVLAKLRILEETDDGFKIAEEDLRRRGPGDLLGRVQSGFPGLRFSPYLGDAYLLRTARKLAEELIETDPGFLEPRNVPMKELWEAELSLRD